MKAHIFREYDIRGLMGSELPLNEVEDLTRAIVSYFLSKNLNLSSLVVGMDGRTHSPLIKDKVVETITQMGIDVIDIGLCPTPVFYFSLFTLKAHSGIMITASHNPKEYNGFKLCFERQSVWGKQIQIIRSLYEKRAFSRNYIGAGTVSCVDVNTQYISWMKAHFSHLKGIDLSMAIDCGSGTAGVILPRLVAEMGWKKVQLLYEKVDGNFPFHEADPTEMKNMLDLAQCLKDTNAQVGIGFDGDCDRMAPLTNIGELVPGDMLLALFASAVLSKHPGAPIVFDIKSSEALIEFLEERKATLCIAPSGHSLIKDAMQKNKALLAGELSCHFFFSDRYFGYDDGIYAMMRLLEIMHETQVSLQQLISTFPKKVSSAEIRLSCKEEEKGVIVDHMRSYFAAHACKKLIMIDGVRAHINNGWGLARCSNTQAVISLRFESETEQGLAEIKASFASALEKYFDPATLRRQIGL